MKNIYSFIELDEIQIISTNTSSKIQFIKDYAQNYNFSSEDIKAILNDYENVEIIIKWIMQKKENSNSLENTKAMFLHIEKLFKRLNSYDSNSGSMKLSKRVSKLNNDYNRYLKEEPLQSNIKMFFDHLTAEKIPTIQNILTIFKNNIRELFYKYDNDKNRAKQISNDIIEEIFKIKKLKSDIKYKQITLKFKKTDTLIILKYENYQF